MRAIDGTGWDGRGSVEKVLGDGSDPVKSFGAAHADAVGTTDSPLRNDWFRAGPGPHHRAPIR
jgi:hypothetical protein